jgi:hypothetical protein
VCSCELRLDVAEPAAEHRKHRDRHVRVGLEFADEVPARENQGEEDMNVPMDMKIPRPTISVPSWNDAIWIQLNAEAHGNPGFSPMMVKAAYVIGIIHSLCESVSCLLVHCPARVSILPAYGVFGSAVELLGRCLNGSDTTRGSTRDLKTGFNWLREGKVLDSDVGTVTQTPTQIYTVADMVDLRHFAAHGQATAKQTPVLDADLLENMPRLLADGLEKYWNELQQREDRCNALGKANVLALRSWPVFLSWSLFERRPDGTYHSMTKIFETFDWQTPH